MAWVFNTNYDLGDYLNIVILSCNDRSSGLYLFISSALSAYRVIYYPLFFCLIVRPTLHPQSNGLHLICQSNFRMDPFLLHYLLVCVLLYLVHLFPHATCRVLDHWNVQLFCCCSHRGQCNICRVFWSGLMTCLNPRCPLRSNSLVCTENHLFIVGIGPILNK